MRSAATSEQSSAGLLEFYERVRAHTEYLCEPLEIEDYIPQPIVDVSPPKWNIAHTTWFFEEMILKKQVPGYEVFDPDFGFLFNSYYNSVGDRTKRGHRGAISRPTVKQVFAYRGHVDSHMHKLLSSESEIPKCGSDLQLGTRSSELKDLVTLGLNHEQQHQELFLTDLKYTFSVNPLFPVYRGGYFPEEESASDSSDFAEIKSGIREIGYAGDGFCFDNELSRHKVYLNDFSISKSLVTNAEFIEFIENGGYTQPLLWHSDGWDWVNAHSVESPLYWHLHDAEWVHFTLGGLRSLPLDAPVCNVSYYEAAAFAEWKGMRLPTEFEWETANAQFDWGSRWEWTNSAYLPYPDFNKATGAVGEYNGKFMINQMVLRGASAITPAGHSRPSYRNFFHPHLRWQFTGIRLAK